MDSLKTAVNANTDATIGLAGIYSSGHAAIGYYNYGSGGSAVSTYAGPPPTSGTGSGSSTPSLNTTVVDPHITSRYIWSSQPEDKTSGITRYASGGTIPPYGLGYVGEHGPNPRMVRAGHEPIMITPGEPQNDNRPPPIVVNQTFAFSGDASFERRRSVRQFAEGAGRGLAAVN